MTNQNSAPSRAEKKSGPRVFGSSDSVVRKSDRVGDLFTPSLGDFGKPDYILDYLAVY
jgi:hypothetical protein